MKKLLHLKVVILVGLLVVSLTGVMQIVFANVTIAKIQYAGKDQIEIFEDNPTLSIGYHEFENSNGSTDPNVEIDILGYQTNGVEFKLLKGQKEITTIEKSESSNPQKQAYYTEENNNIKLNIEGSLISAADGVYTIQAKKDGSIDFKINITVDKTPPTVEVSLGDTSIGDVTQIKDFYDKNELTIKVTDADFKPNEDTFKINGINIKSESVWKEIPEEKSWTKTFTLADGSQNIQNIKVSDEAKNSYIVDYLNKEFIIDTTPPEIKVTSGGKVVNGSEFYTNQNDLNISIKEANLLSTEIMINSERYIIDEATSTCHPRTCSVNKVGDTLEVTISDLPDEEYSITITSKDKVGYEAEPFRIDKLVVDTNQPQIESIKFNGQNSSQPFYTGPVEVEITIDDKNFDKNNVKIKPSSLQSQVKESCWKAMGEDKYQCTVKIDNDDDYEFLVEIFDLADNSNSTQEYSFILDKKSPVINISEVKDNGFYQTADIKVEIDEDHYQSGEYELIKVNEETNQEISIKKDSIPIDDKKVELKFTNLTPESQGLYFTDEGKYKLKVTARDGMNKEGEKEVTFTIDRTKPVVSMKPLNNEEALHNGIKYYKANQTLTFYIDEINIDPNNENQAKIQLIYKPNLNAVDGEELPNPEWHKKDGKYVATIEIEKDGYYEFNSIKVTDKAGNDGDLDPTIQSEKFVIDKEKPIIKVSGIEDDFYYKKGKEVTINVSVDETNFNSDLSTYTIYRKESLNAKETLYQSGKITSQTDFKLPTLTENGEYRVVLMTKDMSNNPEKKELHFYIDHNDPKVSIKPVTPNITNGCQQNVSEVTLALSATDDWKLANTSYTVKRNNEVIDVPKQGEWEDFKLTFKEEGYYQIKLETTDEARTNTVEETLEFTIDRTAPEGLSIIGNANHHNSMTSVTDGESYSTDSVNLQFTAQDAYSFNDITVNVTKNGIAYDSKTFDVKELRQDFTVQLSKNVDYMLADEGEYDVTFTAYDQAGNKNEQKLSFEIDRTSPVIDSNIEDGKYYNNDFLPEFSLDQPERDEFTFINIDDVNYNGRIPVLVSDKVYTISALATDKAQNTTDYEATLTIDKTLPTIEINNLIAGFFKDTLSPSIFYSDKNLDSSTVSIKLNDVELGTGIRDGNGYTKEFEIDKDGNYTLEVSIGDLATNVSKQTIDFILDNEQPTINIKNKITLSNQPWIPELEILEEYGYDIVMVTLNGEEHDITQPITTEGKNVLFIEVMDKSGNVSSLTLQFILDLTPPKVIVEDAATHKLIKDGDTYLTNLDLKVYLDYVSQEGQEDTERITNISLNGEAVPLDNVTKENGRPVYYLSVTEFQEYTLEVRAEDDAGNETVETIMFTLADKDLVTKIYDNKPIFYSLITVTGLAILAAGAYAFIVLKKKSDHEKESSEEEPSEEE